MRPMRADLYDALLARLLAGELAPNARLNESRLAADLGVSRTPLREALLRLEREGFVRSSLARGWTVAPLSAREAHESYPILWTLEGLALRESGDAVVLALPELEALNAELAAAPDPEGARAADARWHETLLSRCDNRRLLAALADLRRTLSRYERLFMADPTLVRVSVRQHAEIAAALARGDTAGAVVVLEANWRFGMSTLLRCLPEE